MLERVLPDDLQDYVEGRLDKRDEAHIRGYLDSDPPLALRIERLRRQAADLRAWGEGILKEPVPERLTDILHGLRR